MSYININFEFVNINDQLKSMINNQGSGML